MIIHGLLVLNCNVTRGALVRVATEVVDALNVTFDHLGADDLAAEQAEVAVASGGRRVLGKHLRQGQILHR